MRNYGKLNPENAFIWRIVHRHNLPWILRNGLHCKSSSTKDPNFVPIGNADLIERRQYREVPIQPGGTLSDYIPFYFTPFSPMMYNIYNGSSGVGHKPNNDLCIVVSSLHTCEREDVPFVFTDRHAYLALAKYFSDLEQLEILAWDDWKARHFVRDAENPLRFERYQAEALIHEHVPLNVLTGIVCYSGNVKQEIETEVAQLNLNLKIHAIPSWFF